MRRYIDNALIFDALISVFIGAWLLLGEQTVLGFIKSPQAENIEKFDVSLITISATLIGFLLTIITVIVTFKKGFEDNQSVRNPQIKDDEIPQITVFEKKITKEKKFYGTEIHKKVVEVFVNATYELGFVLFALLIIQFDIIEIPIYHLTVISFCCLFLIFFSMLRSICIFKLFLKVHLH